MKPGSGFPPAPAIARRERLCLAAGLVALVVGVYAGVGGFGFTNYDDGEIVFRNPDVLAGLGIDAIRSAFVGITAGNWLPLTMLSHTADVSLFGPDPGWHHRVNALFHALNTLLLFLLLAEATKDDRKSALVAALFAVHPLHVESVAWVAERKDLLAGTFFLWASIAHVRYAERGGAGDRLAVVLLFALGLMSKPTVVTLPFALLLLDHWPLRRRLPFRRLLLEKWPLFLLCAAGSAATLAAQNAGGALPPSGVYPFGARAANAFVAWATYLAKTAWPASLSVFYPHPWLTGDSWPAWRIAASAAILALFAAAALRSLRTRPWLAFGLCWFLGTSVPMIGLVHVGMQSMADRYTYLPLIGVFVALAWGAGEALDRLAVDRRWQAGAASLLVLAFAGAARLQASHWRSSETLFAHALDVDRGNWLAHVNLGRAKMAKGDLPAAATHFSESVRLYPNFVQGHNNLGIARLRMGDVPGARAAFGETMRIEPENALAIEMTRRIESRMPR
jgi:hypothetical protein